ncbi:hypothetical protein EV361DRAFT_675483 [Lentinula raphanica]|nr:hypothetical protein EV361DRAFT_675483 [Lentinula raphanica]
MSARQSAYAVLASSPSPFPGPPSEPIPPLPVSRSYTDPVKTKPLPPTLPRTSLSSPDLIQRDPPLDPRKARRHCANFGFKREALAIQAPNAFFGQTPQASPSDEETLASPGLTPPGTFTSTESDVSSFSDLPLDFPQPPPISPVLRRMKSSPLFTLADTSSVPDLSNVARKRWGAVQAIPSKNPAAMRKSGRMVDCLTDLEAELDFTPPFSHSSDSYRGRIDGLAKELQSVFRGNPVPGTLEPPLPPWIDRRESEPAQESPFLLPAASKSSLLLGSKTPNRTDYDKPPQTRSNSTPALCLFPSSSFSSSKDVSGSSTFKEPSSQPTPPRQISKMRSLKFAPECNPSLDRLDVSIQNPKPTKSLFRGRSISMDFNHTKTRPMSMFASNQTTSTSYLTRMGRAPPNGSVVKDDLAPRRDAGLSTPFLHRSVNTSTTSTPLRQQQRRLHHSMMPSPGLKSFIDITPEKPQSKTSIAPRDKVKKLLSRASQVFDWRRKKVDLNP